MDDAAVHAPPDRPLALGELVTLLAADSEDVRANLAAALADPDLRIAHWLPDAGRWVDRDGGRAVFDAAEPGVTIVTYGGRRAALLHGTAVPPPLDGPLMAAVGLALDHERLELALEARLGEQEALRRVAMLVARQHAPEEVFELVTREVARHLDADAAMTTRFDGPGLAKVLAEWSAPGVGHFPAGRQIAVGGPTALAQVQRTLAPARVDSYVGMPGDYPAELRRLGMRAAVAAPIVVAGGLWGAVAAGSAGAPFTQGTEARLGAFAELVAQAIANVDARMRLTKSRARIVEVADEARRRLERDLHDGARQRLVALAMSLVMIGKSAEPADASAVDACVGELRLALDELRDLARGIHPVLLTERGLEPALQALALRSPLPVAIDADLDGRLAPAEEAALYFVATEALTNVARYAQAGAAQVSVHRRDGWAEIAITDDGVGGVVVGAGSGLRGLADRVEALGGGSGSTAHRARAPRFVHGCRSAGAGPIAAGFTRRARSTAPGASSSRRRPPGWRAPRRWPP